MIEVVRAPDRPNGAPGGRTPRVGGLSGPSPSASQRSPRFGRRHRRRRSAAHRARLGDRRDRAISPRTSAVRRSRLPDDVILGAFAANVAGDPPLVLLEPETEGRLVASLAHWGEGPVALYLAAAHRIRAGWPGPAARLQARDFRVSAVARRSVRPGVRDSPVARCAARICSSAIRRRVAPAGSDPAPAGDPRRHDVIGHGTVRAIPSARARRPAESAGVRRRSCVGTRSRGFGCATRRAPARPAVGAAAATGRRPSWVSAAPGRAVAPPGPLPRPERRHLRAEGAAARARPPRVRRSCATSNRSGLPAVDRRRPRRIAGARARRSSSRSTSPIRCSTAA